METVNDMVEEGKRISKPCFEDVQDFLARLGRRVIALSDMAEGDKSILQTAHTVQQLQSTAGELFRELSNA